LNALIKIGLIWTAACMLVSCHEIADEPAFSEIPEIRFEGLSHDTILEYENILTITFKFQDGDGDLGFEEPESYAIFIRDARLANFDGFYLGPVAPPGTTIAVQGKLKVEFPSLFVFGNSQFERTRYYIYMVDRRGHKSNEIITPDVIIKKPG